MKHIITLLLLVPCTAFGQLYLTASYDAVFMQDTSHWKSGFGGTIGFGGKPHRNVLLTGSLSFISLSTKKGSNIDGAAFNVFVDARGYPMNPEEAFQMHFGMKAGAAIWTITNYPDTSGSKDRTNTAMLTSLLFGIGYRMSDRLSFELTGERAFAMFFGRGLYWPESYAQVSLRGVLALR